MIIIKKNERDSIDKMLRRYRQKLKVTKQVKEIRDRKQYTKPSEAKRLQLKKAIYKQKLIDDEQKKL
jgi:small subunit ribosomal protein S21|tara:strand:- start:962 stop:1162 length:201 start_codon:yes stop_codon:yes gene_type:complete